MKCLKEVIALDKKKNEAGKKYPTELHPKQDKAKRLKSAVPGGKLSKQMLAIQTAKMRGNKGLELLEKYTHVLTKKFNSPRNPKFKKKYASNLFGVWDDDSAKNKETYNEGQRLMNMKNFEHDPKIQGSLDCQEEVKEDI